MRDAGLINSSPLLRLETSSLFQTLPLVALFEVDSPYKGPVKRNGAMLWRHHAMCLEREITQVLYNDILWIPIGVPPI